ncbi:aldehyde dehydrogenase family protein [Spirillospora sp. CA-255316]
MAGTTEAAAIAAAGHMLERARWAARAFGVYSAADVRRIASAVANVAHQNARHYAEWAVRETGFGVVEHKQRKNEACSLGIVEEYAAQDFVTPRSDPARKILEIPRPAGVVLALTPSTNPVATLYFKVLLALMTRNAVVVSPHPMAKECCADAAATLARAAVEAGAPDGVIQWAAEPTIPLVEALMSDVRTNVILATGGTGVVRAAYGSGNPAIGVGPGNVPVLVDATADPCVAAQQIVDSKAFDNSVLCTNESVLIVVDTVADRLSRELERNGAMLLDPAAAERLRAFMFPYGQLNVDVVGKSAAWIAGQAGVRAGPKTRLLVAPFEVAVPEEPLTHEKLSPVLGMIRVRDAAQGIVTARAIVRIAGAGHSAAIHSTDPATVMEYAANVPVLRVSVNVGNSTGSAGLDTNLAPTMTIGTGFVGRSSLGENLQPKHLTDWVRVAWSADTAVPMPDFAGRTPWHDHDQPVPAYPLASNDPRALASTAPRTAAVGTDLQPARQAKQTATSTEKVDRNAEKAAGSTSQAGRHAEPGAEHAEQVDRNAEQVAWRAGDGLDGLAPDEQRFREEIRRLVVEELSQLIKG